LINPGVAELLLSFAWNESNPKTRGVSQLLLSFAWNDSNPKNKGCVTLTVAWPFTLKRILRRKKNYGNSNFSPCQNIIFKKSSKRNQNPSIYNTTI
jgi:hypothetical protein